MTDTNGRLFWRVVQALTSLEDGVSGEPTFKLYSVFWSTRCCPPAKDHQIVFYSGCQKYIPIIRHCAAFCGAVI
jgi:hypothetical protein